MTVLAGGFTVCVGSSPELGLKVASPLYAAETEWAPTVSVEVDNSRLVMRRRLPRAARALRVAIDREGHRTRRRPLDPEAVTIAVNVTCWPNVEGFCEDETAVTVFDRLAEVTVCGESVVVLAAWLESPL